ncbi:MAG: hypothetical protein ISS36_03120 [Candidatus Aenigmarchaeota archaeon]|nr:hypothetical protein [Candidatus Aenigmarchaeota archaeon]
MGRIFFSDWSGTLTTEKDDKAVLKQMAMDELVYSFKSCEFRKFFRLLLLKRNLEKLVEQYRDDPQSQEVLLRRTYELFNRNVISGVPINRIAESVEKYATRAVDKLDTSIDEIQELVTGDMFSILTSALDLGVRAVLRKKFGKRCGNLLVYGSWLENDGHEAHRVDLRNYSNRAKVLLDLSGYSVGDACVYMGNDFRDEPCAEFADIFVVPPLATDEFRQRMASTYGHKVRTPARGEVYKALTQD